MNKVGVVLIFKRFLLYIAGIILVVFGISVSKLANLGISPVSSLPYAFELSFGIDFSVATSIVWTALVLLQIVILRRSFKPIQLLQLLCTYAISIFFKLFERDGLIMSLFPDPQNYFVSLAYCVLGCVLIGVGVAVYLIPKWIPMPAEGMAEAIAYASGGKIPFHSAKIMLDCSLVLASAIICVIFTGRLSAVREGTIIAALLVGKVVGIVLKKIRTPAERWAGMHIDIC